MEKISLKERIKRAERAHPTHLFVFGIYVDDYFDGLSRIEGTPYFQNVYIHKIEKHNNPERTKTLMDMVVEKDEKFIFEDLTREEKEELDELRYKLLIEPFARMEDRKRREMHK